MTCGAEFESRMRRARSEANDAAYASKGSPHPIGGCNPSAISFAGHSLLTTLHSKAYVLIQL